MRILHLATWFPQNTNDPSGIFIEKHIQAYSRFDVKNEHFVLPLTHRFTGLQQPLDLFRQIVKKKYYSTEQKESYTVYRMNFLVTHSFLSGPIGDQLFHQARTFIASKKMKFDHIHAHITYTAGYVAMKFKEKEGIPYSISEHMSPFPFPNMLEPRFLQKSIKNPLKKADNISAVSNHLKNEMLGYLDSDKTITIIPNVIEHNISARYISGDTFCFVLIGYLTRQKGIDILIQSASILLKKTKKKFIIYIGGSGPESDALIQMAKQYEVSHLFEWRGFLPHTETLNLINEANAFVCASRHESFGVAVVEALSLGKPVVATDCGGTADTINARNGILVKKEDPESLAEGMQQIMLNYQQFNREEIEQEAKNKYSMRTIGELFYKWQRPE